MTEIADTMMKNCEQAFKTSMKCQDEAARWWSAVLHQTATAQDWQKRFTNLSAIANGVMPLAQERMEQMLHLMEKNTQTSADLLKKAVDAAQTPVIGESQAKWMDFWTSSLGAARSNAESIMRMNSRAIDSWIDFLRKNTEIAEIRVPRAM
jgi:hypothetical protein